MCFSFFQSWLNCHFLNFISYRKKIAHDKILCEFLPLEEPQGLQWRKKGENFAKLDGEEIYKPRQVLLLLLLHEKRNSNKKANNLKHRPMIDIVFIIIEYYSY